MTKSDKPTARVFVLYTGGTFGMAPDQNAVGHPLAPVALDELKTMLPDHRHEEAAPGAEVVIDRFEKLLDSSSMSPRDWVKIADRIEENYDLYDGFVVVQGTDTLSYTASALSFMLENLDKPVVVTGSQLPLGNPRTDAINNYIHSVMVAAYKASGLPKVPEVVVVFADKIVRGCRARKMSASSMAGFDSPNCPLLGEVRERLVVYEDRIRKSSPTKQFQANTAIDEEVLDISLFPGFRSDHLQAILSLPKIKGVIFRTYGSGNGPEDAEFLEALGRGIRVNNKVVVNITQCPQGMVEMGLYAASVGFIDQGMISGLDMTPEAAMTKLMVTLGNQLPEEVKLQMQISQRGEQSMNLFDFEFAKPEKMLGKPWSDVVTPDRRFLPDGLERIVLRIKELKLGLKGQEEGRIDVFLNRPTASIEDMERLDHPRRVASVTVRENGINSVVEELELSKVRNIIGDSNITITLVPSSGVTFTYKKLNMSMFTKPSSMNS